MFKSGWGLYFHRYWANIIKVILNVLFRREEKSRG